MDPIRFHPILKQALWGGERLGTVLNKPTGTAVDTAESWEIADLPGDVSIVAEGEFQNLSIRQLVTSSSRELLGIHAHLKQFPLLVKFLDASRDLSVQVHPSREMAGRFPGVTTGKAEMWVVLQADPDSQISVGLKAGIDRPALEAAIEAGTVSECLHTYHVRPGDCVFLRPGTVHSLGKGLLIAEIQQPNNITYRLDDWKRLGPDGKPRELHIEQALEAINFSIGPVGPLTPRPLPEFSTSLELLNNEFFVVHQHSGNTRLDIPNDNRAHVLTMIRGVGRGSHPVIETLCIGESVLLPADRPPIQIELDTQSLLLDAFIN